MASFVMALVMLFALLPASAAQVSAAEVLSGTVKKVANSEDFLVRNALISDGLTEYMATSITYSGDVVLEWGTDKNESGITKTGAWLKLEITAPDNSAVGQYAQVSVNSDMTQWTSCQIDADDRSCSIRYYVDLAEVNDCLTSDNVRDTMKIGPWLFDWDENGTVDQTITLHIHPEKVTATGNAYPRNGIVEAISGAALADCLTVAGKTEISYSPKDLNGDEVIEESESRYDLDWSPADESIGRMQAGWWSGIRITAPEGADPEKAVYQRTLTNGNWSDDRSFWNYKDSADGAQQHYMGMWVCLNESMTEEVVTKWRFDWDGDGIFEQLVVYTIDPALVNMKTIDQPDGFAFVNAPEEIWVGEGSVDLEAGGGEPECVWEIKYKIVSQIPEDENGDAEFAAIDEMTGVLTFDQPGTVVVQATRSAEDPYANAVAEHTIKFVKKDYTLNFAEPSATATYSEEAYELPQLIDENENPVVAPPAITYSIETTIDHAGKELRETYSAAKLNDDGTLKLCGAGTVVVTATREATSEYNEATARFTLTIIRADQRILFEDGVKTDSEGNGEETIVYGTTTEHDVPISITIDEKLEYDININKEKTTCEVEYSNGTISGIESPGTIVLDIVKKQTAAYNEARATYTLEVVNETAPEPQYSLGGDLNGNGWYNQGETVVISAPEGWLISESDTILENVWSESLSYPAEDLEESKTIQFYLQKAETGGITALLKTEELPIDCTPPSDLKAEATASFLETIWQIITFDLIHNDTIEVTLSAKDTGSGIESIEYWFEGNIDDENGTALGNLEQTGDVWSGNFEIDPDFEEYVYFRVTDKAGNTASTQTKTILLDATVPQIEVEGIKDGYYNADCAIKITITEEHFVEETTWVKDLDREIEIDWNKDEDTYYAVIEINDEGSHKLDVKCTDQAGNEASWSSGELIIDKTKPQCTVSYSEAAQIVDGKTYYSGDITATIKIEEKNFNQDSITVKLNENEIQSIEWVQDAETNTWTGEVKISGDGIYTLTVEGEDLAGNVLASAKENGETAEGYSYSNLVIDTVAPVVDVEYSPEITEENGGFFKAENCKITLKVTERNFRAEDVNIKLTGADVATVAWTHDEANEIHTAVITVDEEANYTFDVDMRDLALNKSADREEDKFAIDRTAPTELTITYRVNGEEVDISKDPYFREQVEVTISAKDAVSGVHKFYYSYKNASGVSKVNAQLLNQAISNANITKSGDTYYATFMIPAGALDATHQFNGTVGFVAEDRAGNSKAEEDGTRIIVDNITPTATVSYSEPASMEGETAYYAEDAVVTLVINEANFHAEDVVISAEKDGNAYTVSPVWTNNSADVHTAVFRLSEDGAYTISIAYTDRSGNPMTDYTSHKLVMDKTLPVITVEGVKANSANKDEPFSFVITIEDENLNANTIAPSLTALLRSENGTYSVRSIPTPAAKASADKKQYVITVDDLTDDAVYTLLCSAIDKAGNVGKIMILEDKKEYDSVQFSINRSGSTFSVDDNTQTLLNHYYVYTVEHDVVIFETNVDPIETYTLKLNGQELKEGTDFTTQQTSKSGEWNKRTYVISKEMFAEEGQYTVTVESVDKTGSTAYSDVKGLSVSFAVDKTAPVLTVSGLSNGGRYQVQEQTVTVLPTDDGGRLYSFKAIVLDADGNPLKDEKGNDISVRIDLSGEALDEYLEANNGMITFTVPEGLENRVRLICNDSAHHSDGTTNETVEEYQVTVSQSAWIIFYANKGLFYGAIGGVAAAILLVILLIVLKKKKNKK